MKRFLCLTVMICGCLTTFTATGMIKNSKSDYVIVIPDNPDTGNQFAAKELQFFLKKASGMDFKTVKASHAPKEKRIFLGLSDTALQILKQNPVQGFAPQEHCVKTAGSDLFLYGEGSWGDLFAVFMVV